MVNPFPTITLGESDCKKAERLASELGELRNSITKGAGNLAGFYGEVATAIYFEKRGFEVQHSNTYDYDLVIGSRTADVKTKRCTSTPKLTYECSVADYNTEQRCDRYIFTRAMGKTIFLLGWISKEDFGRKSVFHRKGETDSNLVRGKPFVFHADCWNIRIDQLNPFESLSGNTGEGVAK